MAAKKQKKTKRQFNDDQRKDFLRKIADGVASGKTKSAMFKELDLSPNMVADWGKRLGKIPATIRNAKADNEVTQLREEVAILKKALRVALG